MWLDRIYQRILSGYGRPEDLALLEDVGSNISPGPFPGPGLAPGDPPIAPFPYKKTTICDLGPSAVSPVMSSLRRFRHEYEAYIERSRAGSVPPAPSEMHAAALASSPAAGS
jgi:NADH-quinone oxidoreductase subunit F